jgi:hypothetical protein
MPFQLSPGVNVTEIDLTTVVPAVATSDGAIAGVFNWGPVGERMLIDSEQKLVSVFGKPNSNNAETWFTAANFLSYSNRLYVARAANTTSTDGTEAAHNAMAYDPTLSPSSSDIIESVIRNSVDYENRVTPFPESVYFVAKYPGAVGNSLKISVVDSPAAYSSSLYANGRSTEVASGDRAYVQAYLTVNTGYSYANIDFKPYSSGTGADANTYGNSVFLPSLTIGDYLIVGNSTIGTQALKIADVSDLIVSNGPNGGPLVSTILVQSGTGYSANATVAVVPVDGGAGAVVNATASAVTGKITAININTPGSGFKVSPNIVIAAPAAKTFNGDSDVDEDYNVIAYTDADKRFELNDELTYTVAAGNTSILDETTGPSTTTLYVSFVNSSSIAVSSTLGGANSTLIAVGSSETGHSLKGITATGSVVAGGDVGARGTITFESPYRLHTNFQANGTVNDVLTRTWEYHNVVDNAPQVSEYNAQFGSGEIDGVHVIVVDEMGAFTGVPGTILETFSNLSRASDAKGVGGSNIYYRDVINQTSQYVWLANDPVTVGVGNDIAAPDSTTAMSYSFLQGSDGYSESTATLGTIASGYDLFKSAEDVDISLILQGKPIGGSAVDSASGLSINNFQLANYIKDNIIDSRLDCVGFVSPDDTLVLSQRNNEATAIVAWRNQVRDSSYLVMDSGYKYQYDRYNDLYRWIPMNGDVAGLCARTDNQRDPWWSPAGFNRGQIKNLVKLRFNPRKADRDVLYKNGVNPVVSFPGQGTVLYGDKTLQSKPSAFDRINVRRLFIVLEKAISTASKFTLFEFNDEFTRAQFKNLINPYLRDVQGRRGITDFLVVCDATNNTPERVDRNEFWGDIYIKPARSINFIQLNFVAVRTGVQFSEIVGQF